MYPASCQAAKPDILDSFLQNSIRACYQNPSQTSDYCNSMERERYMPMGNYSPPNPGHHDPTPQPLPNQWEEVNVRDVDLKELQDVAEDLMNNEVHHQQQQLHNSRVIAPVSQAPHPAAQDVMSYMTPMVKQENVDVFERQQQYSPYLDSSASETGFRSGCEQVSVTQRVCQTVSMLCFPHLLCRLHRRPTVGSDVWI